MTTIFVAKLDFGVTEEELQDLFGQYGTVAKVNIAKDKETGKPRGFAFVEMPSVEEARAAISQLDNYSFNGRNCVVKEAEDRSNSKPQSRDGGGGFKPRTDFRPQNRDNNQERPRFQSDAPPMRPIGDDDDSSEVAPIKQIPKKKVAPKKVDIDTTNDGKSKKPKMNAYKKSGKDNQFFGDDEDDEELDLFGFSDDDEDEEEDYSKYVVNSDEDDDYDDDDDDYDDEDDEDEDDY